MPRKRNYTAQIQYSTLKDNRHNFSVEFETKYFPPKCDTPVVLTNNYVYKPVMPQIVKALFIDDLRKARERIKMQGKKYSYTPSKQYKAIIEHFSIKGCKKMNAFKNINLI